MAVPAVLAQQRRRVPEPGHRFLGHVERPKARRTAPGPGSARLPLLGWRGRHLHQTGGVGELPDLLPQRGHDEFRARGRSVGTEHEERDEATS